MRDPRRQPDAYRRWVQQLVKQTGGDRERALRLASGGEFEAFGRLEVALLHYLGLQPGQHIVDVGCGPGRLARPLAESWSGGYLGIDVVPELVEYARELTGRPEWRFERAQGLSIPAPNSVADFVCFFSVVTHLLHEQSYVYLSEARRVLKPGGRAIVSFLEFRLPHHWPIFQDTVKALEGGPHLNVFIERDTFYVWAEHLGMTVEAIHGGDESFIPLSSPVTMESGEVLRDRAAFGQSVCVLQKP